MRSPVVRSLRAFVFASALVAAVHADVTVNFSTSDAGVAKGIPNWGLDTNWASADNMRRGLFYMGRENVNVVRVPGMVDQPADTGLTADQKRHLDDCMSIVGMADPSAKWDMCAPGSDTVNAWYQDGAGKVNVDRWVKALKLCQQYYNHAFWMVEPFNEPDYASWKEGSQQNLFDIMGALQGSTEFAGAMMAGGSTMSVDQSTSWYDAVKSKAKVGTTHCLYGTVDSYVSFIQHVAGSDGIPVNPEGHNVVEAIVGAEYGIQGLIWWGTAELARGNFLRASKGVRLGYAEDRPRWTAAAVYRTPSGAVQAFFGGSERVGGTTTYTLHSTDRDVYYDGHGPQRDYTVTITADQERMVNITWGPDAQPAVSGRFSIINSSTGLALDVAGGSTASGAAFQLSTYTKATSQLWNITPLANNKIGDLSYSLVSNVNSGLYADLPEWVYADEAVIKQYNYPDNAVEHWYFEYVGQGNFLIRSRWSGKCLSVAKTGSSVVQRSYSGEADQLWRIQNPDAPVSQTPVFSKQPQSTAAVTGGSTTLSAEATGSGTIAYQWYFNGTPIAGATQSTYTIANASSADAGSYTVVATNSLGSATSSAATVTVVDASNAGHLINLSARAVAGSGSQTLIVGFVVGGGSGNKPLLVRGVGPTLASYGVTSGFLPDPALTVFSGSTPIQTNDDWATDLSVPALMTQVNAFPFAGPTSKDSALAVNLATGAGYTTHVNSGTSSPNGSGIALAEFYDASPVYTAETPRLINISARAQVGTGGNVLIVGFIVGGSTPLKVLIRGTGPGLKQFSVDGVLADPVLTLRPLGSDTPIAQNDNWGSSANLAEIQSATAAVHAFDLAADSKDAVILTTLQPGAYTGVISGVNDTTGVALAEVFEVQ